MTLAATQCMHRRACIADNMQRPVVYGIHFSRLTMKSASAVAHVGIESGSMPDSQSAGARCKRAVIHILRPSTLSSDARTSTALGTATGAWYWMLRYAVAPRCPELNKRPQPWSSSVALHPPIIVPAMLPAPDPTFAMSHASVRSSSSQ